MEPELQDKKFTKIFSVDGIYQSVNDHPPLEIKAIAQSIEKAKELNIPIVSIQAYATERYPLREIQRKLNSVWFVSTAAYMVAYALYYDYEKIHLYGIDQGPSLAYQVGKAPLAFWIGQAVGRGVEVVMGRGSLRWTYNSGLADFPRPYAVEEYEKIYRALPKEDG